jgi:hypothetical protein
MKSVTCIQHPRTTQHGATRWGCSSRPTISIRSRTWCCPGLSPSSPENRSGLLPCGAHNAPSVQSAMLLRKLGRASCHVVGCTRRKLCQYRVGSCLLCTELLLLLGFVACSVNCISVGTYRIYLVSTGLRQNMVSLYLGKSLPSC